MKIQYLAVIFIIILMPFIIVFSEYMNTQMTIIKTEEIYDSKLLNSTYDAIKAFQLNTLNSTYYTPEIRVKNVDAAVNVFYNSLITSFKYEGNNSEILKEYVPGVVFTLYDGYYIYSPYTNKLTDVEVQVDEKYNDGDTINGVKPFIPYSCRYKKKNSNDEYIITYSMDNYIAVDIFANGKHERKEGYLVSGITKNNNDSYTYDGVTFKSTDRETLKENLSGTIYDYVLFDGSKYYYNKNKHYFFNINEEKEEVSQGYEEGKDEYKLLWAKYQNESAAFKYYKDAYEFTDWVKTNLFWLTTDNIASATNYEGYPFTNVGQIFQNTIGNFQDSDSNFNRHRAEVIRATITTNLSKAINSFSNYSNAPNTEFLMPKISETDWELLENNICIATFLQGMKVGDNTYNNYSVVANNYTKEFVDENDIYILKKDLTYVRPNDKTLNKDSIEKGLGFEPGVLKINFEMRQDKDGKLYNPVCKIISRKLEPYLQSYTSMAGTSQENSISTIDMYKYMRDGVTLQDGTLYKPDDIVKRAYYTALGREREGSFKVSK